MATIAMDSFRFRAYCSTAVRLLPPAEEVQILLQSRDPFHLSCVGGISIHQHTPTQPRAIGINSPTASMVYVYQLTWGKRNSSNPYTNS